MPVVVCKKCVAIKVVVITPTVTAKVILEMDGLAGRGVLSVWIC